MILKTKAILLKATKYGDTSVIAKMYTQNLGLQSYMVKGIRGEKSKQKAAIFQPGNIIAAEVYYQKNKTLHYIKEYKLHYYYRNIGQDMVRISQLMFIIELLNYVLKEEEAHEELFDFLYDALLELDEAETADINFHLKFLLRLSRHLGFYPTDNFNENLTVFSMTDGCFYEQLPANHLSIHLPQSRWLHQLLCNKNPEQIFNAGRNILLTQLIAYYKVHIENLPEIQSHKILHEVLGV